MKNTFFILIFSLLFISTTAYASNTPFKLTKAQLAAATLSGGKKELCGIDPHSKNWKPVIKTSRKGYYELNASATTAMKNACAKFLTNRIASSISITALPNPANLAAASAHARSFQRSLTLRDVSGTPPTLESIPSLGVANVFWDPGVIAGIIGGTPTLNQCQQFFGVSNVDGESSGLGGCFLAQGVGYTFASFLRNFGKTYCYMQNAPTAANVAAGAITLVSGTLPNDDITQIFTPGAADRLVKLDINGGGGEGGGGGGGLQRTIFVKIYSTAENTANSDLYRYDMWHCDSLGSTVLEVENTDLKTTGQYLSTAFGSEESFQRQRSISAWVTSSAGKLVFDTTKNREINVASLEGTDDSFKSDMVLSAGNFLTNKNYHVHGTESQQGYLVANYAGTGLSDLSFSSGALKSNNSEDGMSRTFQVVSEYRTTNYVTAPQSTTLLSDLSAVDLATDPFYASPPSVTVDTSGYSCGAAPDVEIAIDMSNQTLQDSLSTCRSDEVEDDMEFCHDDPTLQQAFSAYQQFCPHH